jgi:hypothetical protein
MDPGVQNDPGQHGPTCRFTRPPQRAYPLSVDDNVKLDAGLTQRFAALSALQDGVPFGRAECRIQHMRPREWEKDPKTGLLVPKLTPIERKFGPGPAFDPLGQVDEPEVVRVPVLELDVAGEVVWNLIIDAGRRQYHLQCFGTSGLGANGQNYIALSNDAVTETAASTVLSAEIAANGLSRAQGTVVLPTGSGNQTTVDKTFTATGSQSAQKAALFNASSAGTMNHVLGFTQRNLITNDTLQTTFTLTLG